MSRDLTLFGELTIYIDGVGILQATLFNGWSDWEKQLKIAACSR